MIQIIRNVCAWIASVIAVVVFYGLQLAIIAGLAAIIGYGVYKLVKFIRNKKSGTSNVKEDDPEVVDKDEVPADATTANA